MEKILIVEDEEEIACGLSSLLKNQGYVCDCWDGRGNAVEIIRETAPDLILMDIQLPVLDGYEATRRIRAMERNDARTVPIIAMTANAFREDIEKALSAGMDDVATKPLDIKLLIEKIEQVRSGEGPT